MSTTQGSTGTEPEDLEPKTTETPKGDAQETAKTPSEEPLRPTEKVGDPPPKSEEPEKEPEEVDEGAKPKTAKDAIAYLASDRKDRAPDAAKKDDDQEGDKPTDGDVQTATPDTPPKPSSDVHPALKDWSREERKNTKGTVKQRVIAQHDEIEQLKPDAEIGRHWCDLVDEHKLDADLDDMSTEQVAWSMRSQAAAIRAVKAVSAGRTPSDSDLQVLKSLHAGVSEVFRMVGIADPADQKRLDGKPAEMPADLKDAIEMGLITEEDAQAVSAARAAKAKPAQKSAVAQAPPKPVERTERPPAQRQAAPAPEEILYAKKTQNEITAMGVKPDQIDTWFNANILSPLDQHLRSLFPHQDHVAAFRSMAPQSRHEITKDVIAQFKATQHRPSKPPRHTSENPVKGHGTGHQSVSGSQPVKASRAAIDFLKSD